MQTCVRVWATCLFMQPPPLSRSGHLLQLNVAHFTQNAPADLLPLWVLWDKQLSGETHTHKHTHRDRQTHTCRLVLRVVQDAGAVEAGCLGQALISSDHRAAEASSSPVSSAVLSAAVWCFYSNPPRGTHLVTLAEQHAKTPGRICVWIKKEVPYLGSAKEVPSLSFLFARTIVF